ncbi:Versicolorin B desaturase [Beauveria bassiana]|nr:Versicolorin B desaturase [Beauveria bassiana]KAH8708328.1 Cytochrome P450 monooxygenase aclL [Beauveria bassiana]
MHFLPHTVTQSPLLAGLFLVLGVGACYYISRGIYILYFHPLACFPGPKLWLVTPLPNARALRRGKVLHRLREFHEQFGPVVRWSPNELSFIDSQGWRDIYGKQGARREFGRNPIWYPRAPNGAHNILSADAASHARIRKLLSRGFSESALREQERLIQQYVRLLVDRLRPLASSGREVSIGDYIMFATFDIAGELTFGEPFDCLAKEEVHPWVKVTLGFFKRIISIASLLMVFPYLRALLPYLVPKNIQEQSRERFAFSTARTGKRLELGEAAHRSDFVTYICRYNDDKGMSRKEIDATCDILISAGSETTATALSGTLQYLFRNPECLRKLTEEVRSSIAADSDLTIQKTATLPYLGAVLQEGLRMAPPAPSIRPRLVPEGGAHVCGHWLPAGTSVGVPSWSAFRSKRNFAQPDSFIPERWLDEKQGGVALEPHDNNAFMPFSYGPRDCLGRRLAWAEMRLILSSLIWHFDMVHTSPEYRWEDQVAFLLWEKKPLNVILSNATR